MALNPVDHLLIRRGLRCANGFIIINTHNGKPYSQISLLRFTGFFFPFSKKKLYVEGEGV